MWRDESRQRSYSIAAATEEKKKIEKPSINSRNKGNLIFFHISKRTHKNLAASWGLDNGKKENKKNQLYRSKSLMFCCRVIFIVESDKYFLY